MQVSQPPHVINFVNVLCLDAQATQIVHIELAECYEHLEIGINLFNATGSVHFSLNGNKV